MCGCEGRAVIGFAIPLGQRGGAFRRRAASLGSTDGGHGPSENSGPVAEASAPATRPPSAAVAKNRHARPDSRVTERGIVCPSQMVGAGRSHVHVTDSRPDTGAFSRTPAAHASSVHGSPSSHAVLPTAGQIGSGVVDVLVVDEEVVLEVDVEDEEVVELDVVEVEEDVEVDVVGARVVIDDEEVLVELDVVVVVRVQADGLPVQVQPDLL
jgi:hypothetical protein